jgi:hypothetical protein
MAGLVSLHALVGCGGGTPASPSHVGTTTTVKLPESDPPVLTKAVADQIRPGMTQEEVLVILRNAARDTPSAKSSVEAAYSQGKMNPIRYDLTLSQGTRKLALAFKAEKLAEKKQEGLD